MSAQPEQEHKVMERLGFGMRVLDWNRAQENPPIEITKEYWVAEELLKLIPEAQPEQATLESVYETIVQWDEGGGKRSRRELARRIVDLLTQPEQNFCQRCGKRLGDGIHTCTPPAQIALDKKADNARELGLDYEPVLVMELTEDGWGIIPDDDFMETLPNGTKLYTASPKREFVGLTDEEFKFIASKYLLSREAGLGYFQEEIEAKLREKNG